MEKVVDKIGAKNKVIPYKDFTASIAGVTGNCKGGAQEQLNIAVAFLISLGALQCNWLLLLNCIFLCLNYKLNHDLQLIISKNKTHILISKNYI